MLTITIDATGLRGAQNTGTGFVVRRLVESLAAGRPDAKVLVLCDPSTAFDPYPNLELSSAPLSGTDGLVLAPMQVSTNREYVRVFSSGRRVLLFQFDAISVQSRYFTSWLDRYVTRSVVRNALRNATRVMTLSEASALELTKFEPSLTDGRLAVVGCGIDPQSVAPKELEASDVQAGFVLVVASAYAHKQRPFAIRVFDEMRTRGFTGGLVICGPVPRFGSTVTEELQLVQEMGLRDVVQFLGPVSEQRKHVLMANAVVTLYPSREEGFGLIPFESAGLGTPCLTASVSCFPEILGDQVEMAQTFEVREWADIATSWVDNPMLASRQVELIQRRALQHTWTECATRVWSQVDACLSGASAQPARRTRWLYTSRTNGKGLSRPVRAAHWMIWFATRLVSIPARLSGGHSTGYE